MIRESKVSRTLLPLSVPHDEGWVASAEKEPEVERRIGVGRYLRQTSCPGHYGHVMLAIDPCADETPFALLWEVPETTIPQCYRRAITEGILEALAEARWTTAVTVAIIGGSYHPVDSSARDYREAARRAIHQALSQ